MKFNENQDQIQLLGPFAQVVPLRGMRIKGPLADENLEVIENGGLVLSKGIIQAVGKFETLGKDYPTAKLLESTAETQKSTLIPGFIDAHTHSCFAGSRARDYAMRVAGKSYLDIANAGGGIWDSVTQTRAASSAALVNTTVDRVNQLLKRGTTTIEVKSGYGLNVQDELKMLKSIRDAQQQCAATLISTCLAAHMKPRDFDGSDREYLEMLVAKLLPILHQEQLTNRIDIFIEESAFGAEDAAWYLEKAKKMGFDITVHADQFSTSGSEVAVQIGALSADHLEMSGDKEIKRLAQSETVAVALPGASLGLGMRFTPARKLLDGGACLAIASDWNPGSAPMGDLLTQASILGAYEKLSLSETLAAMTFRAAKALGLSDRGQLDDHQLADLQAYPTADYRDIFYHQGTLKPSTVWKMGNQI